MTERLARSACSHASASVFTVTMVASWRTRDGRSASLSTVFAQQRHAPPVFVFVYLAASEALR